MSNTNLFATMATTSALAIMLHSPMMADNNTLPSCSPYILAVDEYCPAPGQFIGTLPAYEAGDDAQSMADKCTQAIAGDADGMISLGGWGGYVTFHFDHPVVNVSGQADLYIKGNAVNGNSEAGIVMVSRDDNGDGLPNDAWYELSGSADADSSLAVTYGYTVTYTMAGELQDVPWTDNLGRQGTIARNAFHEQEYFPQWLGQTLTCQGTLLPCNASDISGNGTYWQLSALRYGYADNLPNGDTVGNSFDIDWAVDPITRQTVTLSHIDFVRVYTALNQSAGWLGETSTEVCGAMDLHPDAVMADVETLAVATFDDLTLDADQYYDGSDMAGSFCSGGYRFGNNFTDWGGYTSWDGFAYASMTSTAYTSLADQYNSCVGKGIHDSQNYGVVYYNTWGASAPTVMTRDSAAFDAIGCYVTNTAYACQSMKEGDAYSKKFTAEDWFLLTATGYRGDVTTGAVSCYLAQNGEIVEDWMYFDLTALGTVDKICFSLTSSDTGDWGMNTPAYFCIDDFGAANDYTALSAIRRDETPSGCEAFDLFGRRKQGQSGMTIRAGRIVQITH